MTHFFQKNKERKKNWRSISKSPACGTTLEERSSFRFFVKKKRKKKERASIWAAVMSKHVSNQPLQMIDSIYHLHDERSKLKSKEMH